MKPLLRISAYVLGALAGLFWLADYLALTLPYPAGKQQWEVIRVDQMYATRNRFNQVEMSHGNPIMETCGNSLLPHSGHRPCWYVKRHTLHTNHLED
ncbi:MAG TPA: hypothetical protein VNH18_00015 [Bryobacteraceae bacterium]|nr:hypothetical protein [Bryobacteraceae bacterium]